MTEKEEHWNLKITFHEVGVVSIKIILQVNYSEPAN